MPKAKKTTTGAALSLKTGHRVVRVRADLEVRDGRLVGLTLLSRRAGRRGAEEGEDLLSDLLRGKVAGLPYCEATPVEPVAGGGAGDRVAYVLKVG